MNRTIMERVRCMMLGSGVPKKLWGEAVVTAAFLINKCPSSSIDFDSPDLRWFGNAGNYSNLKIFGCAAYAHVKQGKLEPRALRCIMLGYQQGVKGYRLWSIEPRNHKLVISRDVHFDESRMPFLDTKEQPLEKSKQDAGAKVELTGNKNDSDSDDSPGPANNGDEHSPSDDDSGTESVSQEQSLDNYLLARDRVRREIRLPARYSQADMIYYALCIAEHIEYSEPSNYAEAVNGKEKDRWIKAMKDEIESLLKNKTWILVKKSHLQKPIGCKWIFKKKVEVSGSEKVRYKARLVPKGYSQKEGVDFNVFSLVVKHSSIRILMALVAQNDWELHQMDVKTAFLHGSLDETIYMVQPEGFIVPGHEDEVCLLKRSLYGLKQSSRQWYKRFDVEMQNLDFEKSKFDGCVYIKSRKGVVVAWLLLYVDDMLIAGPNLEEIHNIKRQLHSVFEMKDLGCAKRILGIDIIRDIQERKLWLMQNDYIGRMLSKYQMSDAKGVSTPLSQQFKLSVSQRPKDESEKREMSKIPYSNIVGSLMYTMVCTRPDLAQAMSVVSRYMIDPGRSHWQALKWIMRYVKFSQNVGILYKGVQGDGEDPLVGFCDSDYAANIDNRKSQSAYIFNLFGSAVSWKSSLQSVVALSTTEAEYISLTEAVKESKWLQGIIADFGIRQESVDIHRHIDVRMHFIRDEVEKGRIRVVKVSTDHNPADMLTKALPTAKFKYCLELVNVVQK